MSTEKLNAIDAGGAGCGRASGISAEAHATGRYVAQCFDKDGNLKWEDVFDNVVCDAGANDALDKYLAGSAYTATWYVGLISATSYTSGPVAGDTSASHGGWTEDTGYSNSTRVAASFSAASARSKALSTPASFNINATTTIKGCFLITNSTKGGTTGTMYSAGLFSGGDKAVTSGDTLNVSYSASL